MMNVCYTVHSGGGHASAPPPKTPITTLAGACKKVVENPFKMHITKPAREMFDTLGRHSSFALKIVFANLWLFEPVLDLICRMSGGELNALVRTTTAFTMMEGSNARNVIPAKASLVSNMRLNPADTVAGAKAYLEKVVGDDSVEITVLESFEPSPISETQWVGLSGETYPDRYKGGKFGIHSEKPGISNYLVPQECRNHMNTHWAKLALGENALYLEKADAPFHFSAIPYTPHQLEQAFHAEELPVPTRTVITVCGAMRGVGGIDTWGSDVEKAYHIHADQDLEFNFRMHI